MSANDASHKTSRIAWQGDSWRLRAYAGAKPGDPEQGIIEHPGSVVIIPLHQTAGEPELLMLRQYRLSLKRTILELPAGTRNHDEPWEACAQRELREETGYRAGKLTPLGRCWPAPGLTDEVMALFLAEDLHPDPLPQDEDEMIDVQPMPLSELVAMAEDGRMHDAKSIVGVLRLAAHLVSNPLAPNRDQ